MSNDVNQNVSTTFRVLDLATAPMRAVAGVASHVGGVIRGLANPVTALLGGLSAVGAVAGIAQLGSSFEQSQTAIAGTLSALGVSSDFTSGLADAARTMQDIQNAAASLPGEAEEYVSVFRTALPNVQSAIGGTLQQMYGFTNQLTAIGRTFGIDAEQIGRDTNMMLRAGRGGAGADVRTFQELLPFMRTLQGQANLTADSFNRMTQPQRAQLLQRSFERLNPMLEHSRNSFDSMWGGLKSAAQTLFRIASAPIFEAMRGALGNVNSLLMDSNGNLTRTAQTIVGITRWVATGLVTGLGTVFRLVVRLGGAFQALGQRLMTAPWFQRLGAIVEKMGATLARIRLPTLGLGGLGGGPMMAGLNRIAGSFVSVLGSISTLLEPFMNLLASVNNVLFPIAVAILPPFYAAMARIIGPLSEFLGGLMNVVSVIVDQARPHLVNFANAIGSLISALGSVLGPIIRIVGAIFLWLYQRLAQYFMPALNAVVDALSWAARQIATALRWLGRGLNNAANQIAGPRRGAGAAAADPNAAALEGIQRAINQGNTQAAARDSANSRATAAARRATPSARGGHGTVNDFRNSRFDISQRFAEGFDPDRVALAFTQDLERQADRRLQSGLEPVFGIR